MEYALVLAAAIAGGAVAALSGFGIGSLLTPVLALYYDVRLAVAIVVVPHLVATALRFWRLRAFLDRRVLITFGAASAVGGLLGAWLHTRSSARVLELIFGALLILSATGQLTGLWQRFRFGPRAGTVAGILSGLLGGLVGNQGGIRTAAMLGFHVPKEAFIATGTAAALAVDLVRMPVYVWAEQARLSDTANVILIATAGTVVGTVIGLRFLKRVPESLFRSIVSALLIGLGVYMLARGLA